VQALLWAPQSSAPRQFYWAAGFLAGLAGSVAAGLGFQNSGSALIQSSENVAHSRLKMNKFDSLESTVAAVSSASFFMPSSPHGRRELHPVSEAAVNLGSGFHRVEKKCRCHLPGRIGLDTSPSGRPRFFSNPD